MELFTNSGLNAELLSLIERAGVTGYAHFKPLFSLMYNLGLRANELEWWYTWELTENENVIVLTSKNGNLRHIPFDNFTPEAQYTIQTGELSFYLPKYETIQKTFNYIAPHRYIVKSKNCNTHIFRHNRIKQLYQQGLDTTQVKTYMGIRSNSTALTYKNSQVYYTTNYKAKPPFTL